MKPILLTSLLLLSMPLHTWGEENTYPIEPYQPKITLFDSVTIIQKFLKGKTKYDYSDRNLSQVNLHYFESHPRKGMAWVYQFTHRTPRRGGDLSIFHFTDGEIIEFHHGP